jgi:hypothetical protein
VLLGRANIIIHPTRANIALVSKIVCGRVMMSVRRKRDHLCVTSLRRIR